MAKQLELYYNPPIELDVDEIVDKKRNIRYIGKATKQIDGKWHCLADYSGALCLVEVNITFPESDKGNHDA